MKIFSEQSLRHFDFWGGAQENANELSWEQFDNLESILEDAYPDGIDATDLNDMMLVRVRHHQRMVRNRGRIRRRGRGILKTGCVTQPA